jgi:hypothetical protein
LAGSGFEGELLMTDAELGSAARVLIAGIVRFGVVARASQ